MAGIPLNSNPHSRWITTAIIEDDIKDVDIWPTILFGLASRFGGIPPESDHNRTQ